jgi:hypothetical protein
VPIESHTLHELVQRFADQERTRHQCRRPFVATLRRDAVRFSSLQLQLFEHLKPD